MSLYTLVYTSITSQKISDDLLKDILEKSRKKNRRLNITGMLLYMDPYFIQVLEGEEATVSAAFEKIRQDPRHQKISVIYKKPITERVFANWSMGFNKFTQQNMGDIEGLSDFLQRPTPELLAKPHNPVMELLNMFRREILF